MFDLADNHVVVFQNDIFFRRCHSDHLPFLQDGLGTNFSDKILPWSALSGSHRGWHGVRCPVDKRLVGSSRRCGYRGVHGVAAGRVLAHGVGCRRVAEELVGLAPAAAEVGVSRRAALAGLGQPRGAAEAGEGGGLGPEARQRCVVDVGGIQIADDRCGRSGQDRPVGRDM